MAKEKHDRGIPAKIEEYSRPIKFNSDFEFSVRLWLSSEGVRGKDRDKFIEELAEEIPLNYDGSTDAKVVVTFLERKLDLGY